MARPFWLLALAALLLGADETVGESEPGCPDDMVQVPGMAVCIDRFPWPNIEGEKPAMALSALPEERDIDAGEIWDISTLCERAGKRACRIREWIFGCRGPEKSRYPWGDTLPKAPRGWESWQPWLPCNADRPYIGLDEDKVYLRDPEELARVSQLEPAGARPGCVSASGMQDAIGQVEEWVECPQYKKAVGGWCLMGGHVSMVRACNVPTQGHWPRWHYAYTGGRCCLDKE